LEQYAGYKNYNVLLKRADEKVKLSNYVVDSVYLKIIEKKLGTILLPGRDYRRVRLH
ncbi:MAG: serotonin receptor, partial [Thaumarchaeota archaeon]|nr:serotonin receptor [Nitrososphaerota archaeon]